MERIGDFRLYVNRDGYTVINGVPSKISFARKIEFFNEPYLIAVNPPDAIDLGSVPAERAGRRALMRLTRDDIPLHPFRDHPGLFRTFVDVRPEPDSVIEFANQFGSLGVTNQEFSSPGGETEDAVVAPRHKLGEPLRSWRRELVEMREWVELWEATQNDRTWDLGKRIIWTGRDQVYYRRKYRLGLSVDPDTLTLIASRSEDTDTFRRFDPGDLLLPAVTQLQRAINERLPKSGTPRLLWDDAWTGLSILPIPRDLIDCLWVQFALAVASDARFRRCQQCKRWFPEDGRSDRVFCSDACRAKAYRLRKTQPRDEKVAMPQTIGPAVAKLLELGKSAEEIAFYLHVEQDAVDPCIAKLQATEEAQSQ
jgi:hypothetical protein